MPLRLTRKPGEWIKIGDIEVGVVEIRGKAVRIGIKAAKDVNVVRSELRAEKKETSE